jgi:hypothetical protein
MQHELALLMTGQPRTALWYWFDQNNSGGHFYENDDVGTDVFIEAYSEEAAIRLAHEIFEDYSDYCECCGERWSYYSPHSAEVPSRFGKSIFEDGEYGTRYNTSAIFYGLNGAKARYDGKTLVNLTSNLLEGAF